MTTLLILSASLLYTTAIVSMVIDKRSSDSRVALPDASGIAALACHGWAILQIIFLPGGADLSLLPMACAVSWLLALLGLAGTLRAPTRKLLPPLYLLAVISLLSLLSPARAAPSAGVATGLGVHILLSVFAYSVITVSACQAVILSLQHHQLKARNLHGLINTLPPLQTMELLLFDLLAAGLMLLTLSILSGALFLDDIFAQQMVHKTFFTLAAWLIFSSLLWGRIRRGWRGKTAVRGTLTGFSALMLAYFGTKIVLALIAPGT